jgi:7,8-dihydroneopterin aldolase/epimerase/oxygenase
MVTVELNNIILHGHHGVYEEERKLVNTFEVNLSVSYNEKNTNFEGIGSTINYVELYEIVKQKMQAPGLLLERICQGIIHQIKHQYAEVREVRISIYKIQAPMQNFQGKAGVTLSKKFEE